MRATYAVAGSKPWVHEIFHRHLARLPGRWHYLATPQQLTLRRLRQLAPRKVFFIHWSWKVDPAIVSQYECVGFHMTNLPYGRGGSPLQHLILRGHKQTQLTALRMTEEFDAGPVYAKQSLSLEGRAEDIYRRMSQEAAKMIAQFVRRQPAPVPQRGRGVRFVRRTPEESRIPTGQRLRELYDFIRMLDAPTYPRAFLDYAGLRFEFSHAALQGRAVTARVRITAGKGRNP